MTRVLVADDHAVLRDSLRVALTDAGLEVVGEAQDGQEAVELAVELRPDLVLMDLTMPVLDGLEATRRLRSRVPRTRVVILTMHADEDLFCRAREAGAVGYLVKDASLTEVVASVQSAAKGRTVLSLSVPAPIARDDDVSMFEGRDDAADSISPREQEVLQLLVDGCAPSEVAQRLFISPRTVKNHLASIYEKFDVHDRTQAVLEAVRRGVARLEMGEQASSGLVQMAHAINDPNG